MSFNNFRDEINYLLQQPIPPDNSQQEYDEFQRQLIAMNPLALSKLYEQYKTHIRNKAATDLVSKRNKSIYLMHHENENVQHYIRDLFIKDGFIVKPAGGYYLPLGFSIHLK